MIHTLTQRGFAGCEVMGLEQALKPSLIKLSIVTTGPARKSNFGNFGVGVEWHLTSHISAFLGCG